MIQADITFLEGSEICGKEEAEVWVQATHVKVLGASDAPKRSGDDAIASIRPF